MTIDKRLKILLDQQTTRIMNHELWNKVLEFDLDKPISEYGFSTRIANENYWTINFTKAAILEYKKFMYLAATSDMMVSPSEIIDTVWHEHLVFTQSYSDFCKILGKEIKHIPSTHNRKEVEKFRLAKERTSKLYESNFGKQPAEIWSCSTMFEPLGLDKFSMKLRTFLLFGLFVFVVLIIPFYVLLKPIYITIDSSDFILDFMIVGIISFIILEVYNRKNMTDVVQRWNKNSFVFKLTPIELVFLKTGRLAEVIHYHVNQLVEENKIKIGSDQQLSAGNFSDYRNAVEFTIIETLRVREPVSYSILLNQLLIKSVFANVSSSLDAFKKYFMKSKVFMKLFAVNFIIVAFVFMLGFVRLLTGLAREKPITFISFLLLMYFAAVVFYLFRVCNLLTRKIITKYYVASILPDLSRRESNDWNYFLLERNVLSESFAPVVSSYENARAYSTSSDSDSGSSSGSSCGSSCSSCGGCGGGD